MRLAWICCLAQQAVSSDRQQVICSKHLGIAARLARCLCHLWRKWIPQNTDTGRWFSADLFWFRILTSCHRIRCCCARWDPLFLGWSHCKAKRCVQPRFVADIWQPLKSKQVRMSLLYSVIQHCRGILDAWSSWVWMTQCHTIVRPTLLQRWWCLICVWDFLTQMTVRCVLDPGGRLAWCQQRPTYMQSKMDQTTFISDPSGSWSEPVGTGFEIWSVPRVWLGLLCKSV